MGEIRGLNGSELGDNSPKLNLLHIVPSSHALTTNIRLQMVAKKQFSMGFVEPFLQLEPSVLTYFKLI